MSHLPTRCLWKPALVAISFSVSHPLQAAVTTVDWLNLSTTGNPGNFSLLDDSSGQIVTGSLSILANKGQPFPNYPRSRTLAAGSWTSTPSFMDSLTETSQVSAIDLRVVPENGAASYSIDLAIPAGTEMILMIGGLFRDAGGATEAVIISTSSSLGGVPVELLEQSGWGNGITSFGQPLDWDVATDTLSTLPASNGDSAFAFFRVKPLAGLNTRLLLQVPAGFASGAGDEITIGLGTVVPEPTAVGLAAIAGMMFSFRRRRSTER